MQPGEIDGLPGGEQYSNENEFLIRNHGDDELAEYL